jgi:hypothetical protein
MLGVEDVKGSTKEVRVVRIKDFIGGKAFEVASPDDVLIRVVDKGNDWVKEVFHILMTEVGMVLESIREIE